MRLLQVVDSLDPRFGGLTESVLGMSRALRKRGIDSIQILTSDRKGALDKFGLNSEDRSLVCSAELKSVVPGVFRQQIRPLISGDTPPDVVHSHGLWSPLNHIACSEARRRNIKLVIQTHGMLDAWALKQSPLKKVIALHVYQQRDLTGADLLVATCMRELVSIRNFGLRNPVAVIPNGLDTACVRPIYLTKHSVRPRTALFLSRLHPKKGIDDLLIAWSMRQPRGWRLRVVGDGDPAYVKNIRGLISKHALTDQVFLEGGCYGEERYRYYEEADLFILPSYGENFGIAILEALAHGLPVLTTDRTPWDSLEKEGCGWIAPPGIKSLSAALQIATDVSGDQLKKMGIACQRLASRYEWDSVALQFFEAYRWLRGEVMAPDFISID